MFLGGEISKINTDIFLIGEHVLCTLTLCLNAYILQTTEMSN